MGAAGNEPAAHCHPIGRVHRHVTLQRPGHAWPLLLAANRDERLDRSLGLSRNAYWPEQPGVIAGRGPHLPVERGWASTKQGWSPPFSTEPAPSAPPPAKRLAGACSLSSRSIMPRPAEAAHGLSPGLDGDGVPQLQPCARGPQTASGSSATTSPGTVTVTAALPPGLHMVTARDPDDATSARVTRHLPRFRAARVPEPPDWGDWPRICSPTTPARGDAALNVPPEAGFGTICASLLALPVRRAADIGCSRPVGPARPPFEPAGGEGAMRLL